MKRFAQAALIFAVLLSLPGVLSAGDEPEIDWQPGPTIAKLGNIAEIAVPRGYTITGAEGTAKFAELNHNPPSKNALGTIVPVLKPKSQDDDFWFIIFEFKDIGYVSDDEKDSLDAGAILDSIKAGTEHSDEIRRQKGWETLTVLGWMKPPYYDRRTHDLVWAIRGADSK
jgi:uncharacterized membrane-anchored protein